MKLLRKSKRALDEGGINLFFRRGLNLVYRKISVFLPQVYRNYNGIKVPSHKLGGSLFPGVNTEDRQNYEEGLINSIEDFVNKDDKVLICGGGLGVTAVKASEMTRDGSKVTIIEGSESQLNKIEKTLRLNNAKEIQTIHGIVGPEKNVWGSSENAERFDPSDLPECDVLEMDIEGSEIEVLKNLESDPRIIIVESHGYMGASTEKVKSLLQKKGYKVRNVELAEKVENARKNDIKVITGEKFSS